MTAWTKNSDAFTLAFWRRCCQRHHVGMNATKEVKPLFPRVSNRPPFETQAGKRVSGVFHRRGCYRTMALPGLRFPQHMHLCDNVLRAAIGGIQTPIPFLRMCAEFAPRVFFLPVVVKSLKVGDTKPGSVW